MDVKKLGVVVEQKGIAPTAKNLESLAKASDKAAPAVERLSSSLGSFKSTNLDSFASKLQDTSTAIKEVKAATSGMADMAKNILVHGHFVDRNRSNATCANYQYLAHMPFPLIRDSLSARI